jgi:L-ascorbate metabolism protein UlaG (beta-lactamase superfamily)
MAAQLTYVGHATVLIELDGVRLLTDPLLRGHLGPLLRHGQPPAPGVSSRLDAVLLSHLHQDHADLRSLRRIDPGTPVIAPAGAAGLLERAGRRSVTELRAGERTGVGDVVVRAVPARHDGGRKPRGPDAEAIGFELVGSSRVYFAGDTDRFEEMEELAGRLDVALLPVWGWGTSLGPGHLNPEGAAEVVALLRPRLAIPIHWGTLFPLGLARLRRRLLTQPPLEFERRVAELAPEVEVRVLAPGEATQI